jgi:transcriptional regulator with XRE-family HTH domain
MNKQDLTLIPGSADLGDRLAVAVGYLGLSQSEVAKQLETSASFISDVMANKKKPGSEFLLRLKKTLRINLDWLISGEGDMFGNYEIDVPLLRSIRLNVAIAKEAVGSRDATAKALLFLIRDGRIEEAMKDPDLVKYLDGLCPDDPDWNLAFKLYNQYFLSLEPAEQQRNMLNGAVEHYAAETPIDKSAALAQGRNAKSQVNIARSMRVAGRDYYER